MSDHKEAALLLDALSPASEIIADRGYDSDRFRTALGKRGVAHCIPPRRNRKVRHAYDATLYRERRKVEMMCNRLKDGRRIAMRYGRCAHTFFSAIALAASALFSPKQRVFRLNAAAQTRRKLGLIGMIRAGSGARVRSLEAGSPEA